LGKVLGKVSKLSSIIVICYAILYRPSARSVFWLDNTVKAASQVFRAGDGIQGARLGGWLISMRKSLALKRDRSHTSNRTIKPEVQQYCESLTAVNFVSLS